MGRYVEAMKLNCPCCKHRLDPPGTHGKLLCNAAGGCPECRTYWTLEDAQSETRISCENPKHRRIKKSD